MEYLVLLWGVLPDVGGWFESLTLWQIIALAAVMLGAVLLATRFN
jgi:hypothetical protein